MHMQNMRINNFLKAKKYRIKIKKGKNLVIKGE
jgi:hypothetical protein